MKPVERKLLYELDKDSRLSYRQLATKMGSKKTVVAYHFNRLLEEKMFWKFVPVISLTKLGIYSYKIYFQFQGLTKKEKEEMIQDLISDKHICWLASTTGAWDLCLGIYAKNVLEFSKVKNKLFHKYAPYVQNYAVSVIEDAFVFNRDYLLEGKRPRRKFVFGGEVGEVKLDLKQKEILRLIRNNARYNISEISSKLNCTTKTTLTKIRDLEKKGVIQGYTTFLNINKLGLQFFKVSLYLQDHTEEEKTKLLTFAKSIPNVIHIIKSIGSWEIELEIEAEEIEDIYQIIEELKTKFPHTIKKTDITIINKEHKLDFFPEWY
tara:strand:+ start:9129 stop:10091 length:963 start_codon:yes stop_codon:yes gene_type:complete